MSTANIVIQDCGKLRIEWQRVEDRWLHTIGLVEAGEFVPFMRSVEGDAHEEWPTSPALQELHVESRGLVSIAFLTGMAGASHWSASVHCDVATKGATFDLACRVKQEPRWLGSSYQTLNDVRLEHTSDEINLSQSDSDRLTLLVAAVDSTVQYVEIQAFAFVPQQLLDQAIRTHRWKYVIGPAI